jgi:glutathione S-transferase
MTIQMYDLCGAEMDRRFSPFCWRAKFALAHKQVPYETVAWKFTEKDVIAAHSSKTVPVIVDGDRKVSDSWAIAEYLEDTYPDAPPLFPNGSGAVRFIKAWTETVLHPGIGPIVMYDIFRHVHPDDVSYFRESREARIGMSLEDMHAKRDERLAGFRGSLNPLRATLAVQPWLNGDTPAHADHIVMAAFMWARGVSDYKLLKEDDPINDWRNRMLDLYGRLGRDAPGYEI